MGASAPMTSTGSIRAAGAPVSLAGVGKRFAGVPVLDDVSLTIRPGSFVSLLGPSGCGKSTVLRLIAGLESADVGTVSALAEGIGFVLQDPTLMPWATALDNVRLPLRFARVGRAESRERAMAALAGVGLQDAAAKYPRELSGGMKMRVAVARALVGEPRVLLMDEPFAALDEITRFRLGDDLAAIRESRGLTIVFVTHSVFEAVALSDRVVVMAAAPGRIVADLAIEAETPRGAAFRASAGFSGQARTVSLALEAAMASAPGPDHGFPDPQGAKL